MINNIFDTFPEIMAGLTVAVVALPLALGFGVAATGTPEGALLELYGAIFTIPHGISKIIIPKIDKIKLLKLFFSIIYSCSWIH